MHSVIRSDQLPGVRRPTGRPEATRPWNLTSFRRSLVPMVVADDRRRYVAVNPAACLLLRLNEDEVLKLRIDDLASPDSRSHVVPLWEDFLRAGTQEGKFELLMPDGASVEVEYSATANIEPGRHLAIWMFPPGTGPLCLQDDAPERPLTPREREVLGMIAMGMDSGWISAALGVSHATVETHVRHCLEKLGARNRAHAIVLGLRAGEITLD